MSVEAMAVALHHSRSRGTAKLVLIGIANHDGDGGAWPSIATLAKYAAVTPRNVQKALRELEALGEIRTHRQAGGMGSTPAYERPNLYDFTLTCPEGCDRTTKHRVTPPVGSDIRGVSEETGGGVSDATPKPSCEPSTEPSSGSDDPWATKPPHEQARRKSRKPKPETVEEMNVDFARLRALCIQEGQEDPVSVWWTLRKEHKAAHPAAFMARLVEFGEWEGFVAAHGIGEYTSNGEAA